MLRRVCFATNRSDAAGTDKDPPSWPVSENPSWHKCIQQGEIVRCEDAGQHVVTLVPIRGEHEVNGLLIIETRTALGKRETDLIAGILSIIRNHVALLDYGDSIP